MEYFNYPYAFVGFESHIEFTQAIIFCQNENIDVLDFMLNGVEYIAVFCEVGFDNLIDYCQLKSLDFVYFVIDDDN